MRLSSNDYIKERKEMISEDEFVTIKYTYARLNKIKKTKLDFYEEIKDKRKAIKELDLLEKEMERYVSIIRKNRKSNARKWSPNNKYRTNYKTSF